MTSIFKRIKDTISNDIHGMLDKKDQRNPLGSLNQYLRESEQEKEKVRKLLVRQHKLREEFNREYLAANDLEQKRERQAEMADIAEETELHQFAINEQAEYRTRAERMQAASAEASEQLSILEEKFEEMQHKLKDMHLRRLELMGRENTVRAQHEMQRVISATEAAPFQKFAEIENHIQGIEYQVNQDYQKSTFDYKMAELERAQKTRVSEPIK